MLGYANRFKSPEFLEEMIVDQDFNVIGTIRVKPSSVMWKPKGSHKFHSVKLGDFTAWITSAASGSKLAAK